MRSITWNGQTMYRPGGLTRINANALAQIGLATNGIIGLVGEADGGEPQTIITIDDPALAKETFISGPLANAIRLAFDPSNDPRIPGGAFRCLCVKTNDSTQGSLTLNNTVAAPMMVLASKQYGVNANQVGVDIEAGIAKGAYWSNAYRGQTQSSADLGGKPFLYVEYTGQSTETAVVPSSVSTAGGANTITLGTAAWAVNAFTNYFVLASGPNIGATPNLRKIASNTATQITVTNNWSAPAGIGDTFKVVTDMIHAGTATAGAAATITSEVALNVALNELAGLQIVITGGTGAGQRRIIASNTAGATPVITVTQNWTTIPDATSVYAIRYCTQAQGSFVGSYGVATKFSTTLAVNGGAPVTTDITFSPGDDILKLVTQINATGSYTASVPAGIDSSILVNTFDFDAGNTSVELRNDKNTITSQPTYTNPLTSAWPNVFKRDLQVLIDDINTSAQWITAARSVGTAASGSGRPAWLGATTYLSGGTRGTTDNTKFQSALDLLLGVRCNFVIPLISQNLSVEGYGSTATFSAVAAQLSSHVDTANGVGKSERGGLLGMKGTITQVIAQAGSLNSEDIQLGCQQLKVPDVDGNLALMDEWSIAVAAAGMRSGAPEVGEPLTHKYIKTYDLQQDSSWSPSDRTDANAMIGGGVLFAEFIQGKGTRWVRDLTTYIQSENLAYAEGSVRDVVRYVAYNFRSILEDRFTGVKATPANASAIKQVASSWLDQANADNIIVTSLNSSGVLVPGYENLRVTISGDIATIKVTVYPAVGINWQLNDVYLQLPMQSA